MLSLLLACAPFSNPIPEDTGSPPGIEIPSAWAAESVLYSPSGQKETRFGVAMAEATDLAGDGEVALLIGASTDDGDRFEREGCVWVYHEDGSTDRVAPSQPTENLQFGAAIASGDVDGDGYTDLLVNENKRTTVEEWDGALVIRYGSASGPDPDRDDRLYARTPVALTSYGTRLAALGDIDVDGRDDFIIGVPQEEAGVGAVDLYYGGELSPVQIRPPATEPTVGFGSHVLGPTDINQDGQLDILLGAVHTARRAWWYTSPDAEPQSLALDPDKIDIQRWPAAAHDVNADGYPDLIAGKDAAVFPGSASGFQEEADALLPDEELEISTAQSTRYGLMLGSKSAQTDSPHQTGGAWILIGDTLAALLPPEDLPTTCFGVTISAFGSQLAVGDDCQFQETGAVFLFSAAE